MSKMYNGSIDLNKIDKSKIVTTDKDGNAFQNGAKYLNVVVWLNDQPDQYGNDASIQISQSKEERESKEKAIYIGNLKEYKSQQTNVNNDNTSTNNSEPDDSGLPF